QFRTISSPGRGKPHCESSKTGSPRLHATRGAHSNECFFRTTRPERFSGRNGTPDLNSTEENANEIRDQLVRTGAGFAHGVRECPEANPGGIRSMEGARQFQGRILRGASR